MCLALSYRQDSLLILPVVFTEWKILVSLLGTLATETLLFLLFIISEVPLVGP